MSDTIYVWITEAPSGKNWVLFGEADSPSEAAERIILKLAAHVSDTEMLIGAERNLRENAPMVMDFSERVGALALDIKTRQ